MTCLFCYMPLAPNKTKVGECQQDTLNFSDNIIIYSLKKLNCSLLNYTGATILNYSNHSTIINY